MEEKMIDSKALSTKLKYCQNLLTIALNNNIFLKSKNDKLNILVNNLDIELELKTDIESNIQALVDGKKLYQIISQASDDIELSATEKQLKIKYGSSNFKINLIDNEYIAFPKFKTMNSVKCNLKKALNRTSFVVSDKKSIRSHVLNGVYFDFKSGNIVATDGHRLAIYFTNIIENSEESIIVPYETIKILELLIEDEIEILWNDSMVEFRGDDFSLRSKLIDGKYPNYITLIPKNQCSFMIDAKKLTAIINRISVISEHLIFNFEKKDLIVSSTSDEGEAIETQLTDYNGQDMKISFNAPYLKDVLSKLDGEIRFELKDNKTAGIIRHGNYQYILMPLRVK